MLGGLSFIINRGVKQMLVAPKKSITPSLDISMHLNCAVAVADGG